MRLEEQAFAVEPAFGGKTLTRGELAFLAQSGVKGLLETGQKELMNEELESRSLELEL